MEAPKEENYHQAEGKWGNPLHGGVKKNSESPQKSSLLSLVTKLQNRRLADERSTCLEDFRTGGGVETSRNCPRRASPIQLKHGSVRHGLRSLVVFGFVCLAVVSSTARRLFLLFFLFTDFCFYISSIRFGVFFFSVTFCHKKLPCPSNMGK